MEGAEETQRRDDSATQDDKAPTHAHVHVVLGPHAGQCQALSRDGLVIGRAGPQPAAGDAGQLLLDDPWISRRHARMHAAHGVWQLSDLGGRNRAFVEGRPLHEGADLPLGDGCLIRIGDTLLIFRASPMASGGDDVSAGFPGCAPPARQVRQRLAQLAHTSGHVLVLGETGTGKEGVARALAEPDRPFVPQNCAQLTRELARSELFGHLRGAFSGATGVKIGLVEIAERGVLFLDEIGELSLEVQAELLRFLEDGWYRPIGATELRRSSARIVAATNVDLEAAVLAGRFRRDLLTRLLASNPPLELPPLRARREDILPWARRFFAEAIAASAPQQVAWNPGTAECLLLYPWSGNLRELRGVVHGLASAGRDLSIAPEALPPKLPSHRRLLRSPADGDRTPRPDALPLTREHVESVLAAAGGSIRATALQLGIDRRKLYRTCERLGIDLDRHRANPDEEA